MKDKNWARSPPIEWSCRREATDGEDVVEILLKWGRAIEGE